MRDLAAILSDIASHPNAAFNVASCAVDAPTIADLVREARAARALLEQVHNAELDPEDRRVVEDLRTALSAHDAGQVGGVAPWRAQKDFEKWAKACVNGPETVRALEGAYGQGWVDHAATHPTPRADAAPRSTALLSLLREAREELDADGSPMSLRVVEKIDAELRRHA